MTSATDSGNLRGRPVEHRLGDVVAAFNVLSVGKTIVNVQDIASLLDIDFDWAAEIIDKLDNPPTPDLDSLLPLTPNTDRFGNPIPGEFKSFSGTKTARIKPLRLTDAQASVCREALDTCGADQCNPLRQAIEAAFFPVLDNTNDLNKNAVTVSVPTSTTNTTFTALYICASSIAQAQRVESDIPKINAPIVTFGYKGQNDLLPRPRTRRVIPTAIRLEHDIWEIEAIDLDALASYKRQLERNKKEIPPTPKRTFHAHKIENPQIEHNNHGQINYETVPVISKEMPAGNYVTLVCKPHVVSHVLSWDDARLVSIGKNSATIKVPYFRGSWLPRRVLALGDTVTCTNKLLKEELRYIAEELLERAEDIQATIS